MEELVQDMVTLLKEKKGENITVIDVENISSVAEAIVIVTANSQVHCDSLVRTLVQFYGERGLSDLIRNKKPSSGNPWQLLDASNILINVFLPEAREFYSLEKIFFKGRVIYKGEDE